MAEPTAACSAHRELVELALSPDASDEVLEQYALEVPGCEACQRALAARLQVHPVVLDSAEQTAPPSLAGMAELLSDLRALEDEPVPTGTSTLRGLGRAVAMGAGLSAAAAAGWLVLAQPPAPKPRPPAVVEAPTPAVPQPAVDPAPAPRSASAEAPIRQPVPAPHPRSDSPGGGAPASPAVPEPTQVARAAFDWPAPPFVELRKQGVKGGTGLRSAQLVLGGSNGSTRHVGDIVSLTVVSSASTELAVCVTGPERGVVWRGGVPAGRVELTDGRTLTSFAFAAPGTYRFALSTSDLDTCTEPVHVVEMEVQG